MAFYSKEYDLIVIGAGHAGCEGALAAARMGLKVLLFNLNLDTMAQMACNPAVGGLAKGHVVKEIDALGGVMGELADLTGIQFRTLNLSKGPAVRGTRVQCDKQAYRLAMKSRLEREPRIDLREAMVERLLVEDGRVVGVVETLGLAYRARAVLITTGTFLNGLIHIGETRIQAGRAGEFASTALAAHLQELGFKMGRLKTGTPPRLRAGSIDFAGMSRLEGDPRPRPFSWRTRAVPGEQLVCFITHTNLTTHQPDQGPHPPLAPVQRLDPGGERPLLSVPGRQGDALPGQRKPPGHPGARGPGHRRDLRQGPGQLPAGGAAVATVPERPGVGGGRGDAPGLRHRVRLRGPLAAPSPPWRPS